MFAHKLSRRAAIGGLLASTSLTVGARRAWSQAGPIRIGTSITLSGGQSQIGHAHLSGATIAVQQINENGGIGGRQVELVFRDNRYNANDAVAQLRELSGSGINLIMGDSSSSQNLAIVPLAPSLGIVYVAPTTIAMEVTHDLFNPNCFRAGQSAYMQFLGQAKAIADRNPTAKRWGCLVGDTAGFHFAQDYLYYGMRKFYAAKGIQIELVDPVLVKMGAPDFRDQVAKLASEDLDGILLCHAGGDAITFLKQGVPFGLYKNLKAFGDMTFMTALGPAMKKDLPKNYVSTCTWYYPAFRQFPMVDDFYRRAVQETKNAIVDPYMAQAHLALTTIAEGVRRAKSTKTSDVIAMIETMTYPTIYGPMHFRKEDHQLEFNMGYLELNPDESSEAGWKVSEFISVPWRDAIDPPSPGRKFELPKA
jgi:branched-chain amino acid transport system substrate-binding protein